MRSIVPILATVAFGIVLWGLSGALALFGLSRISRRPNEASEEDLRVVAVVPALNEGRVIAATVRHLLGLDLHAVVVIDDGSDDNTRSELKSVNDARLCVLTRKLPDARQGKGAALNAVYQRVMRSGRLGRGLDSRNVVMVVVDADGRLDSAALTKARAAFTDPKVGACQVAVRIRNREDSFWTRMQNFEFVAFTHMYQKGREWTGSVGLGGNGQFVRMAALESLGDEPWTNCLTEDMDLGIRLLIAGWRNKFLPDVFVSQQGVPTLGRLLRQRTRWFQGTLQCLHHIPAILRSSSIPLAGRIDLVTTLFMPVALLALSPVMLLGTAGFVVSIPIMIANQVGIGSVLTMYALVFTVPLLLAYAFVRHEPGARLFDAIIEGHEFVLYGLLWPLVAWGAIVRIIRGRGGWQTTDREAEGTQMLLGRQGVAA